MKISSLIDLMQDAEDLLSFFEEVDTREQLVSRLDRLKRGSTEEMMLCVEGLRASIAKMRDDTFEMSQGLPFDDDDSDDPALRAIDAELASLAGEFKDEPEPPEGEKPPGDAPVESQDRPETPPEEISSSEETTGT